MFLTRIICTLGLILLGSDLFGTNVLIEGQVKKTETDEPIQNVNVYVINLKTGGTTNENGKFKLSLQPESEYIVEFSHIAYETVIMKAKADQFLDVFMKEVFLKFNSISVTGMKCDYALMDVPVYTEVISKNKIIESGSVTISDALKQHSGVSHLYDPHGMFDYNLLGLDSKYILILKNGKPISGKFRDMVDLDQIMVSNVDRVEIVKGPVSSLHGSDAIGGVVNIITKEIPEKTPINVRFRKSYFNSNSDYNNDQLSQGNLYSLNLNKRYNEFYMDINGLFNELFNQNSINPLGKDAIAKVNLDSEISWQPKDKANHFVLILEHFNQKDIGRELIKSTGFELSSNKTDIQRNTLILDHKFVASNKIILNHAISKSNYSRRYKQTGIDSTFMMNNIAKESVWDYNSTLQFSVGKNTSIIGFDFFEPSYNNQRLTDTTHAFRKNGLFIQNEYAKGDKLKIVLGVRNDKYQYNNNVSPRVAVIYKTNNNYKLRFSVGKGFRAPSIMETFIDFHNIDQGYIVKGNPDLKAEISLGSSLNIEFSNSKNLKLNGLIYNNNFNQKILAEQVDNTSSHQTIYTYKNIESATYKGLELFGDYLINSRLSSKFNINFRKNIDGKGRELQNSVPYSTQSEINYLFDALKLRLNLVHSFNYRHSTNSSFSILDILFSKKIANIINLKFGIKNVNNYTDNYYGPYMGRSISFEVSN